MSPEQHQCLVCGYLLDQRAARCPVCLPNHRVPEHIKDELAVAHLRGLILDLAKDGTVVRESATWEQTGLMEEDLRPLLARMEENGEIERFAQYYRVRVRGSL